MSALRVCPQNSHYYTFKNMGEKMITPLEKTFDDVLDSSDFLHAVKEIKRRKGESRLFGDKVRCLTSREIETLKAQGNRAQDWNTILVAEGFTPDFIVDTQFYGTCVIGKLSGGEKQVDSSVFLPSGIYKSTVIDSEIGHNCLVYDAGVIAHYIIKDNVIIYRTDAVIASNNCTFGNGRELSVGIETGGREILSYAEITIPVAHAVATRRDDGAFLEKYRDFVTAYVDACKLPFGVIESGSIIRSTGKVEDTYIGEHVIVDSALLLQNSTVFGTPEEPTEISHGAYVRHSCVQWGCTVTSMALVDDAVLTEHSHVERHGKVTQSIIGPNTGVAEGEVTACLVGPFVGFHHQALLIAAMWPEGKGNVAYGANVGSNHTSKAPDQEIWCGEGMFFGLGVNVKYPSDFTEAPYSIIATAVNMLPQRIEFPFSLINSPSRVVETLSPAYNEIFPGWVLYDNIYTVKRNEGKYKKRNKAKRTEFIFDVFRPDTVSKMISARNHLRDAEKTKEIYTAADIPGLGKNYMTKASLVKGIEAYTFYIEYYVLCGLKQRVSELLYMNHKVTSSAVYDEVTGKKEWEYQRSLMTDEGLNRHSIIENLNRLSSMQEEIARDTKRSKEKDDSRGMQIIGDYDTAHTSAHEDSFVKEVWRETETFRESIKTLIGKLSGD